VTGGREKFGSKAGFVLAAAGSAVGLGNIWKFPYMAGQNGGGAFLVIYLVLVFTIGVSVMLAEFAIGRAAERNPVGAFAKLKGGAWPVAGYLGVITGFVLLSFYSVVAGWTLAYMVKMGLGLLDGATPEDLGKTFGAFTAEPVEPVIYHAVFMALTIGVVARGVGKGIERTSRVLMPVLFVLLLALVVRAVTLPGAHDGLAFFLAPDFSKVDGGTFNAALAQAFFSLSLGMGAMTTYGSYLSRSENLPGTALWVTSLDSMVAILAGCLILPAVFAFGFDPSAGPGLVFITLPAVFSQMPLGGIFGTLFFVLLAIAALTSAVSMLEVVVAYLVDERGTHRVGATVSVGGVIFVLGIPSSLSFGVWRTFTIGGRGFFESMDYLATNLLLPAGGVMIVLFVGWVIFPRALEEATSNGTQPFAWAPLWRIVCRYLAPVAIAWVLISGL
jgi:NSS family neurotransmitter:Na+ symporter